MQKIKPTIGQNIFICGGSCSGKTSTANYISENAGFSRIDYDKELIKLFDNVSNDEISKAINEVIQRTFKASQDFSLVMDHWMPPKYEERLRQLLNEGHSFYVWLYCSDVNEIKKRLKQRRENGDGRQEYLINKSQQPPTLKDLEYDYVLDTANKKPKEIARLILKNSSRYWSK